MKTILLKPVEIIGHCPAGLMPTDELKISGMNLTNPEQSRICFLALSHFPPSIWQLQSESRFFSHVTCPGCITDMDHENRVVFLLGHEDKWDLCLVISDYLNLSHQYGEPTRAICLKEQAIRLQNQGLHSKALRPMREAVKELKRAVGK